MREQWVHGEIFSVATHMRRREANRLRQYQEGMGSVTGRKRRAGTPAASRQKADGRLDIEIQLELMRMRAQTHRVYFTGALVIDPHGNRIRREHIPLGQEFTIGFQRFQRAFE